MHGATIKISWNYFALSVNLRSRTFQKLLTLTNKQNVHIRTGIRKGVSVMCTVQIQSAAATPAATLHLCHADLS